MTVRHMARRLLERGLSVIPVPQPRHGVSLGTAGDGKVPAIPWSAFQTRLPTMEEVDQWFNEPMNIGVVTGQISGVVVIDADEPGALHWLVQRLPYTPWQTQTARGFHLWYRAPDVRVPNQARIATPQGRLAIDVRGDGGFVIAPGSLHASGVTYLEAGDWNEPRERVPVFWPGWLERPKRAGSVRPTTPAPLTGESLTRARKYLAAMDTPEIGRGSDRDTLYAACRLVRGFALSVADAEALLWEWAGDRPGWTREWVASKVRHAKRYGTEPIGSLL